MGPPVNLVTQRLKFGMGGEREEREGKEKEGRGKRREGKKEGKNDPRSEATLRERVDSITGA